MGRKDKTISTGQDALVLLGARLRKARQDKGVRLSDLAEALDYTKGHLSAIENGKGRPSRELVQAYEHELGLRTGELMPMPMDARQKVALSRRRSPISDDILALLEGDTRERGTKDPNATLKEIEDLLGSITHNPNISPEALQLLAGFLKAGLMWLQSQDKS